MAIDVLYDNDADLSLIQAKKVAITAVMRRIIVLANTLLREDRDWQPERP